jgi:hypothetical protein
VCLPSARAVPMSSGGSLRRASRVRATARDGGRPVLGSGRGANGAASRFDQMLGERHLAMGAGSRRPRWRVPEHAVRLLVVDGSVAGGDAEAL